MVGNNIRFEVQFVILNQRFTRSDPVANKLSFAFDWSSHGSMYAIEGEACDYL